MNNFKTTKIVVPIDRVIANQWNPNFQSQEMFAKGVQSVKELGMLGSILVRETAGVYEILDGEHRWRYCKELHYTEIPVENIGEIDDKEAQLLTILLNNLRGKDDIEKRAKIYEELSAGQLSLLPFSSEEIENEKRLFSFDFSRYENKETLPDRKMTRTFMVALTEEEYIVVQKAIEIAKADYRQSSLQWLMEQVRHYLQLHLGGNVDDLITSFPVLNDVRPDPLDTTQKLFDNT